MFYLYFYIKLYINLIFYFVKSTHVLHFITRVTTVQLKRLQNIRRLLQMNWEVKFVHVFREVNGVADELASLGCTCNEVMVYHDGPPKEVGHLIFNDARGTAFPRRVVSFFFWPSVPLQSKKKVYKTCSCLRLQIDQK